LLFEELGSFSFGGGNAVGEGEEGFDFVARFLEEVAGGAFEVGPVVVVIVVVFVVIPVGVAEEESRILTSTWTGTTAIILSPVLRRERIVCCR